MSGDSDVSIIVPVYSSGGVLCELTERIEAAFGDARLPQPEIILVDDCGPGAAWPIIQSLVEAHDRMVGIQLMRNFGQHNALMCGFQHAMREVVVTMDDDLQHQPESVLDLIRHLVESEADLVYGVYQEKKHGGGRNLGSWLVNRFYRTIFRMPITVTSFRAMRRELMNAILRYDLNFTYIDGLLAWNTQRIETLTVPHHERVDGKSGYTIRKLITLAMNVFTNFSLLPLQIVTAVGTLAALGGLTLGACYVFAALLSQIAVPGYASIIVAVLVLGGLQLMSLGVMGEYLGRLHLNVNRKPQYTVRQVARANQPVLRKDKDVVGSPEFESIDRSAGGIATNQQGEE